MLTLGPLLSIERITANNQDGDVRRIMSPSGKYCLIQTAHKIQEGCWNVTRGRFFSADKVPEKVGLERPFLERLFVHDNVEGMIACVDRNYRDFPLCWIEDHPDGHDYAFCGSRYMGQTIIQLDTGKVMNWHPSSNDFCTTRIKASPSKRLLAVAGCFWGGSYDTRVYDFSDPMCASEPLPLIGEFVDIDEHKWTGPEQLTIGKIEEIHTTTRRTRDDYAREYYEDESNEIPPDSEFEERFVEKEIWLRPQPATNVD